jgi:HAD superfamily hydrolase (TIGR01509 family)
VAEEMGGLWPDGATAAMQEMSSGEWARAMQSSAQVDLPESEIIDRVVAKMLGQYQRDMPLFPGAMQAVYRLSARWPLAMTSSSNRVVIEEVLTLAGLTNFFRITVSSEEVEREKPSPDVYLEATRRLHLEPRRCVAIEDSPNGLRAAAAAGLRVVAIPDRRDPLPADVRARAALTLSGLGELTVEAMERLEEADLEAADRRVDAEEDESFPASDAHSDWAGPPN